MKPFIAPKSSINKDEIIRLRKEQEAAKKAEVEAKLNAANLPKAEAIDAALLRTKNLINPADASDRLRIIFDNSGSMVGTKLQSAKEGVVEFLRNCTPNATSVAVHLLNLDMYEGWDYEQNKPVTKALPLNISKTTLTSDIVLLASEIVDDSISATGGTPLYETIDQALVTTPKATRLIAFSDGEPNRSLNKDEILASAKRGGIPIDTVYITDGNEYRSAVAIAEMQYIAEMTGGIFLDLSKGNIKDGLKYLAPTKRLMLMNSSFKAKVEKGEVK